MTKQLYIMISPSDEVYSLKRIEQISLKKKKNKFQYEND